MELKLKPIHVEGIVAALAKADLYRNLNEPEEAESICQDILAIQSSNQAALRLIGLAITDQFTGNVYDRYGEVENIFRKLSDSYEQLYCIGLLYERRAKAQMRAGRPAQALVPPAVARSGSSAKCSRRIRGPPVGMIRFSRER
jgi:hypothetical protein